MPITMAKAAITRPERIGRRAEYAIAGRSVAREPADNRPTSPAAFSSTDKLVAASTERARTRTIRAAANGPGLLTFLAAAIWKAAPAPATAATAPAEYRRRSATRP